MLTEPRGYPCQNLDIILPPTKACPQAAFSYVIAASWAARAPMARKRQEMGPTCAQPAGTRALKTPRTPEHECPHRGPLPLKVAAVANRAALPRLRITLATRACLATTPSVSSRRCSRQARSPFLQARATDGGKTIKDGAPH